MQAIDVKEVFAVSFLAIAVIVFIYCVYKIISVRRAKRGVAQAALPTFIRNERGEVVRQEEAIEEALDTSVPVGGFNFNVSSGSTPTRRRRG